MFKNPLFTIPETVKEDTQKFQQQLQDLLKGDLSPERFKGIRVPMGVYGQRSQQEDQEKYMVRVRLPAGVVFPEQLSLLSEIAAEYGQGFLHFTTRQDVQIHGVDIEDTDEILFKLLEYGLSPRGGGGNTVRNIANSSRAGVHPEEPFDTTPYALALSEYLLKARSSFNLPRKYKIAFSSTKEDEALATVNDLGFIARVVNGEKGFKVYAAGGMGNSPLVGLLLMDFIPARKVFHVAEAIKRFFDDYGDRNNKHQARLRFVRKRLGDEEFRKTFQKYYQKVINEGIETEEIQTFSEENKKTQLLSDDDITAASFIYPEKHSGYYSMEITPENGDISCQKIDELLKLIEQKNLEIRSTNRQGFLIRRVKAVDLDWMIEKINKIDQTILVSSSVLRPVACKGASTCRLGLCLSPELARAITGKLSDAEFTIHKTLPRIYISGCPNSCGQHHIASIGLEGKAKRYQGKLIPYYSLLLGGKIAEGESKYGEKVIDLPARRIPDFLYELAHKLSEEEDYSKEKFNNYLEKKGTDKIIEIAEQYIAIPDYQDEPEFYKDWGQNQDFSLAGRGPGECGTGVLDIVKLDLDTARDNMKSGIEEKDNEKLYQAIIAAARSLLIVRGIDTEKDRLIMKGFKKEFIEKQLVDVRFEKLLDQALDYKLGDEINLFNSQETIKAFIQRIEKLYNSLDASLEFNLESEEERAENEEKEKKSKEKDEEKVHDLRGVKCPLNFVKAKLFIEPLPAGTEVTFYLDEGAPIKNVPRSLAGEGHQILDKKKTEDGFYILEVKKKGE